MWTVLFGDHEEAENEPADAAAATSAVKTRALSPEAPTAPVTPVASPEPLVAAPDAHVSAPIGENYGNRREESKDSAMAMLLKRLNNLMVKVGQHEFEKKTLVDQMVKERASLVAQIEQLKQQVEDVKDQNVQLQYKVEFTSEPMLMEKVQDITDMRDALADVKKQLEVELHEKEKELKELKSALKAKDKHIDEAREKYVKQTNDVEKQLKEKELALQKATEQKAGFEASLVEKEHTLNAVEATKAEVQQKLVEVLSQNEVYAKELEQLQRELDKVACEREQTMHQVLDDDRQKLEILEKRAQEQEALAVEKAQELEDYKHDCVELWKTNEELKQQIALASAAAMTKQAEFRENALSGQSHLQAKVSELESQLEELQGELGRKDNQIAKLQTGIESRAVVDEAGSGEDDDKFVVVEGGEGAIGVLTEQVATAQRELTESMELNLHLNNRNAWLEEQYQMLSSVQSEGDDEHESADLMRHSMEERGAALEQELQEAQHAANEKAEHVSNLERNYSALSTEFNRLRSAHDALVEVKQVDEAALSNLRQELDSLRSLEVSAVEKDQALFTKDQELAELRIANAALSGSVEHLRDTTSQLQQTHDALVQAQKSLVEAEATNSELKHELVELREIADAASANDERAAAAQNELNQVRSEKSVLVAELARSQPFVNDLQLRVQELEGHVDNHMNEKRTLEQQLRNLQEMAQENMDSSFELQSSLESTMEELEKTQIQMRAEQEKCKSLQQEVETVKQSSVPREELDRAQNEIASLELKVHHFHDLEQFLTQQLQDAVRSKDEVAAELQTVCSERVAANEEHKTLKALYEQAAAQLTSTQSSASELQRSNDDLTHSLEQARAKVMQTEQQLNAMRAEHGDLQRHFESLAKKNLSLVSEIQSMRDEADNQQTVVRGQLEKLKVANADVEGQLAEATQALRDKDTEIAAVTLRSQKDMAQLEDLVSRFKADRQSSEQRLAQLNAECEHLRQAHSEVKTMVDRSRYDLEQVRAQLHATTQEKASLEAKIDQLRGSNEEIAHLREQLDEHKHMHQRLEETNRDLNDLLQKSKAYCDELSRDSEDKISRVREFTRHVEQEARDEIDRIAHENELLRDELAHLARTRFEETNALDEFRVKLAELQAENNVLSARACRLTQQLSQYTDLPEDDELAAGEQGPAPDLWKLLSSGMEQLKADLELASKYAASIDAGSVDGGMGDESFTNAS